MGAAALTGGITRAISTAIIAVELTGQGSLTLPLSLTVIVAYFTANRLGPSVYVMHPVPAIVRLNQALQANHTVC